MKRPKVERPTPDLPPVDPGALESAVRKVLSVRKPPGGWPGKPPKEVRADEERDGE